MVLVLETGHQCHHCQAKDTTPFCKGPPHCSEDTCTRPKQRQHRSAFQHTSLPNQWGVRLEYKANINLGGQAAFPGTSTHPLHVKLHQILLQSTLFPTRHTPKTLGQGTQQDTSGDNRVGSRRNVLPESPPGARQLVPPVSVEEGTESGQPAVTEGKKKESVYMNYFAGSKQSCKQRAHSEAFNRKRLLIGCTDSAVHQEASTLTHHLNQDSAQHLITGPVLITERQQMTDRRPPFHLSHQGRTWGCLCDGAAKIVALSTKVVTSWACQSGN